MSIPVVVGSQPDPEYTLSVYDLEGARLGDGSEFLHAKNVRFSKVFNGPGELSFQVPARFEEDAFRWRGAEIRLCREGDESNPVMTGIVEYNSIEVGRDLLTIRCPGLEVLLEDQIITWSFTNQDVGEIAMTLIERFVNRDKEWVVATFPGTIQESGYGADPEPPGGTALRADKQRPKEILDTCSRLAGSWAYRVEKIDGVNTFTMEPPPGEIGLHLAMHHQVRGFKPEENLQDIITTLVADGGHDPVSGAPLTTVREDPAAVDLYRGRRIFDRISNSQITDKPTLIRWCEQELAYRTSQLKQGNFELAWRHYDPQNRLQILDPRLMVPNMKIRLFGFDDGLEETVRASRFDFDLDSGKCKVRFGIRHDYLAQRFRQEIDQLRHNESDRLTSVFEVRQTIPAVRHLFGTDFPNAYHWGHDHFFGTTHYAPRNGYSHKLTFSPSATEVTV